MRFPKTHVPKTKKSIEWVREGECMICTSHARNHSGYPFAHRNGKYQAISRHILERKHGPLGKLGALHSCDNPACINPSHLRPGTQQDNVNDAVARGRMKNPPTGMHKGESHAFAKLDFEKVRFIKTSRLSARYLAKQFGVARQTIDQVRSGKCWKEVI